MVMIFLRLQIRFPQGLIKDTDMVTHMATDTVTGTATVTATVTDTGMVTVLGIVTVTVMDTRFCIRLWIRL